MRLYHGTDLSQAENIIKKGVDVRIGRKYLDFGQGFYLTPSYIQAKTWSERRNIPCVLEFELDDTNLKTKQSYTADREWAEFVIRNRLGMPVDKYDCVAGPMADTGVSHVRRDYLAHRITFERAVNRLIGNTLGDQIVVLREEAAKSLVFIRKVE